MKTKITKIELIKLGDLYPLELSRIEKFGSNSKIFRIEKISENLNDEILQETSITLINSKFINFPVEQTGIDFTVVIVNRPLEGNYFTQRISNKLIVVSIFGLDSLNIHEGITLEMYVNRLLLSFTTIYQYYGELHYSANDLMQTNSTGCLFDFCKYKPQIASFFIEPKLSSAVINALSSKTLPENYINNLQNEIKTLKISNYYFHVLLFPFF